MVVAIPEWDRELWVAAYMADEVVICPAGRPDVRIAWNLFVQDAGVSCHFGVFDPASFYRHLPSLSVKLDWGSVIQKVGVRLGMGLRVVLVEGAD